jgi:AmpE protein
MNLIALLIGLLIERLATQLFHWRRMRWLDRMVDAGFRRAKGLANWPALIPIILLVLLLALPVFVVIFALGDSLLGFPYLFLAIVVLFFSLGPKDIGEDVSEYCTALEDGDEERVQQTAKALIESDVPQDSLERIHCVESAVFVQANNRLFAVIFWFVALGPFGPLGAWIYRVTDLIRRRAVFNASRDEEQEGNATELRDAAIVLHGWLAWIPARLTAVGYAVAGHFEGAFAAWRAPSESAATTSEGSENLLARVGVGALALAETADEDLTERGVRGAAAANKLVFRLLLIWAVIIAAMTLYGWSV